jgi:hypothetical protein
MLGTIDDAREHYSGFEEAAVGAMEAEGIPVPHRPKLTEQHDGIYADIEVGEYFDGRMPMVVKTLSLAQISALYALFMNWYAYVFAQEKKWKAKMSEALKLNKHIEAACRRLHAHDEHGDKRSDQLARVLAKLDVDFMEAERNLEITKATHDMIEAQLKVANKNLAMISREITLRGMQIEAQAAHRGFNKRYGRALQAADEEMVGNFDDGGGDDEPQRERRPVGTPAKAQGVGRFARARAGSPGRAGRPGAGSTNGSG